MFPEIPELKKRFDLAVICSGGKGDCENKEDGIEYYFYEQNLTTLKKIKYVFKYPFCRQCREDLMDIWRKNKAEKRSDFLGRLRKSIEFYACGEEFYLFWKKNVAGGNERDEAVYYTFWCNECSLPMIIHRQKYPAYHLITRLQGYDLFDERYLYGRQPFKKVINRELEKLFFVAYRPMHYYLERYPELDRNKVEVHPLGSWRNHPKEQKMRERGFVLVSCSNVIPLKRVNLIVESLALMEEEISWIHFGTGESAQEIEKLAQQKLNNKSNISYFLKGYVSNQKIRSFYEENEVDCFLTTSSSEGGSPVSIMEAMAAGIPIIGTAVGDIPLMIDGNGILLELDTTAEKVAAAIRTLMAATEKQREKMGKRSIEIWEENFNAEKNGIAFVDKVEQLLDK